MKWKKHGLVYGPDGSSELEYSHAFCPTPFLLSENYIRVYYSSRDLQGRSRPFYIDVDAFNPTHILRKPEGPLFDIGEPGTFDDNGCLAVSIVKNVDGSFFLYYVGFELYKKIRYKLFSGLAISTDGHTFKKYSKTPILDRTNNESNFRCGPFVMLNGGRYRMWYVAGSTWYDLEGKQMPLYDLKYMESNDGIHWPETGTVIFPAMGKDSYGYGRPWIWTGKEHYELYYCVRRISLRAHRLGYATSSDLLNWRQKDADMALDITPGSFDSEVIMSPAVIQAGNKTWCFYNGNNFGRNGFAVAELLER